MQNGSASYFDLIKLFHSYPWSWESLIATPLGTSKQHVYTTLRRFVGHPDEEPTTILQVKILARAALISAISVQLFDILDALAADLANADDDTLRTQHLPTLTALAESLRALERPPLFPEEDAHDRGRSKRGG